MDVACPVAQQEGHSVGHLGELAGAAQGGGAGLGIAGTQFLNGDAAGVGQRGLIGQGPQAGGLQDAVGDAHHPDALLAQLLGPGTGQGVDGVLAGGVNALALAALQAGIKAALSA